MIKFKILFFILSITAFNATAQVDTINTITLKVNKDTFHESKTTYAVFWKDSIGNHIGGAEIWERSIRKINTDAYQFDWKWHKKDTLYAHIVTTGELASMKPNMHYADYFKQGNFTFSFNNNTVSIPEFAQTKEQHKKFKVLLNPPAFVFSMDLEILPLLPFTKIGQTFALAFYEPGAAHSAYYKVTVINKEELALHGNKKINCWLLRIDYAPNMFATFWISDKPREVIKMEEYYQGKYRYKKKLF